MIEEQHLDTFEFLKQKIYLPGYMALASAEYDSKGAEFLFEVKEPKVTRGSIVNYFTPRGIHICVSQGGYALVEKLAIEGELGNFDILLP